MFKTTMEHLAFEHNDENGHPHDAVVDENDRASCDFCGWPSYDDLFDLTNMARRYRAYGRLPFVVRWEPTLPINVA